jgi:hypothetical protein
LKISHFIFEQLYERVIKILPQKEIAYLPDILETDKSWKPLCDLIFIVERFYNSKVFPHKYEIVYSSKFDDLGLNIETKNNLINLKKLLESGDNALNNYSTGFLPPSSKKYLTDHYGTTDKRRFIVDFTNQFFGIKHFHLDSHNRKEDVLLYYVTCRNSIYFLKIGGHNALYEQTIIENIVHEFPELLNHLGIGAMPDIPMGNSHKYSIEEMRDIWISGGNVSFQIDNYYYTSCSPQTFSRLNASIVRIFQTIYYQINFQMEKFTNYLKEKYPKIEMDFEIEPLTYNCEDNIIIIGEKITREACQIKIDYLSILKYIDIILE